jgi:hypothetical protein
MGGPSIDVQPRKSGYQDPTAREIDTTICTDGKNHHCNQWVMRSCLRRPVLTYRTFVRAIDEWGIRTAIPWRGAACWGTCTDRRVRRDTFNGINAHGYKRIDRFPMLNVLERMASVGRFDAAFYEVSNTSNTSNTYI